MKNWNKYKIQIKSLLDKILRKPKSGLANNIKEFKKLEQKECDHIVLLFDDLLDALYEMEGDYQGSVFRLKIASVILAYDISPEQAWIVYDKITNQDELGVDLSAGEKAVHDFLDKRFKG